MEIKAMDTDQSIEEAMSIYFGYQKLNSFLSKLGIKSAQDMGPHASYVSHILREEVKRLTNIVTRNMNKDFYE